MQWTNTSARKALCELVYKKIIRIEEMREMFLRYSGPWRNQVRVDVKDHFHGLGCFFLQSAIGLRLPFEFRGNKWTFDSWIEYKVKQLKIKELPCPCIWVQDKCRIIRKGPIADVRLKRKHKRFCPFFAVRPRRLDLCWIEGSLLDNVAITAEVEVEGVIKQDLAKVHTIFMKSPSRGERGFNEPILHIQMDVSGKNHLAQIISFMKKYWSNYALSPSIIYVVQKSRFSEWVITYLHRGNIIKSKMI